MKKYLVILVLALTATLLAGCASKDGLAKQQKAETRYCKKQAREFKKYGWMVPSESRPLEDCLREAYRLTNEVDEKGFPKYVDGEATTVGETFDAAHFMSLNLSKLVLASKIESQLILLIETRYCFGPERESMASLYKALEDCRSQVAQKLGRVITPIVVYRDLPKGNVEVRVQSFYDHQQAFDIYKQALREELEKQASQQDPEKKAEELSRLLDGILK